MATTFNVLRSLSFLSRTSLRGFFLLFLSLTLSAATKSPSVRVPIFGFHDIVDAIDATDKTPRRPLFNTDYQKRDLYHFLNYLVVNDYWFLSSQDLFVYFIQKSKPIPPEYRNRKPVMITFDDGYSGVHENVLPILKDLDHVYREKVKIVLFVNPAYMGIKMEEYIPHMSCDELRDGFQKGFYDIQSHGYAHQKLTRLNAQNLRLELEKAKSKLRECTQDIDRNKIVAAHIAYPFGAVTRQVERYLPGYHLTGYLYDDVVSRPTLLKNPFRISRIPVNLRTTTRELVNIAETATPVQ